MCSCICPPRQQVGRALCSPKSASLFFPSLVSTASGLKRKTNHPVNLLILCVTCVATFALLFKGQKGREEGLDIFTQPDLPWVVTSELCLHGWRTGSFGMEGGDHMDDSGGYTTSLLLFSCWLVSCSEQQRDEICKVLLCHLAPSVSFLIPFLKTCFQQTIK